MALGPFPFSDLPLVGSFRFLNYRDKVFAGFTQEKDLCGVKSVISHKDPDVTDVPMSGWWSGRKQRSGALGTESCLHVDAVRWRDCACWRLPKA